MHLYVFRCKDKGHEACFYTFGEQKFIQLPTFLVICHWELGCEPLTHMGNKTNGEPQIWVERTVFPNHTWDFAVNFSSKQHNMDCE